MAGRKKKRLLQKYDAKKQGWLRNIKIFILLVFLVFLFFRYVVGFAVISGVSMRNTFQNGDLVLYSRINKDVEKGQIIAVSLPSGEFYVKRVIATGGDIVDVRGGKLYVNGELQTEEYVLGDTWAEDAAFAYPLTVEEGDLFVLGDNREESIDSRFFGSISQRQIAGVLKVKLRFPIPEIIK